MGAVRRLVQATDIAAAGVRRVLRRTAARSAPDRRGARRAADLLQDAGQPGAPEGGARVARHPEWMEPARVRRSQPPLPDAIDLNRRHRALEPRARDMAARLNLQRLLVVVNLATTGALRQHDRLVAILAVELWPSGDSVLRLDVVNPTRPISPEATAAHGITDEDVRGHPGFPALAAAWQVLLTGCDIAGMDCEGRDVALIEAEYYRAGIDLPLTDRCVDARRALPDRDRRDLQRATEFHRAPTSEYERPRVSGAMRRRLRAVSAPSLPVRTAPP